MDEQEYRQGYEQGIKDFAERIKKYYKALKGNTTGHTVAYTVDIFKEEIYAELCIKRGSMSLL